jgi:hypothetical protein
VGRSSRPGWRPQADPIRVDLWLPLEEADCGERLDGAVVEGLGGPVAAGAADAGLVVAHRGDAVAGEVLADRGQVAGPVAADRPGAVQQHHGGMRALPAWQQQAGERGVRGG